MTQGQFIATIKQYYSENRRDFIWRQTRDPYKILVSEIMLQQTQTERVKQKYAEWLDAFPTVEALANAPLQKVLTVWKGLGYNRRAMALKRTAETVVQKYSGQFPSTYEELVDLPGIGPYTAGAVLAFAFNKSVPIIETNIRTVYIHFFFKDHGNIHDKEILALVQKTMDQDNPRDWYYALMDYGVMLKKSIGNLNVKSQHYTRQSTFKGSNRQLRAAILHSITVKSKNLKELETEILKQEISATRDKIEKNIEALKKEGFIIEENNLFKISI